MILYPLKQKTDWRSMERKKINAANTDGGLPFFL